MKTKQIFKNLFEKSKEFIFHIVTFVDFLFKFK